MIKVNKKKKKQSKWRIQRKEEGSKESKNLYKKFSHSKNLKLMCELAKTPRFVAIPKCKQFELKIKKHKETQSIKMKRRKERRTQRNCIVNHPPMKQNERQKNLEMTMKERNNKYNMRETIQYVI